MPGTARLAVVGTSGYAFTYLRRARALHDEGRAVFVGACDIRPPLPRALPPLLRAIDEGRLGRITGIGAAGAWVRTDAYYARNPWAGRRWLDGQAVVDGALTNPFSHAVATALLVAGMAENDPLDITLEL